MAALVTWRVWFALSPHSNKGPQSNTVHVRRRTVDSSDWMSRRCALEPSSLFVFPWGPAINWQLVQDVNLRLYLETRGRGCSTSTAQRRGGRVKWNKAVKNPSKRTFHVWWVYYCQNWYVSLFRTFEKHTNSSSNAGSKCQRHSALW